MNINLFQNLISVCTNLLFRIQALQQQIEIQSLEIADLKAQQKQQLSALQKIVQERDQEIAEAKSNLFAMVSHELRTPLTTIFLNIQSLLNFYHQWSEEKRLFKLQQVEIAAQKMKEIIQNILTINRLEANNMPLNNRMINLVQFCQDLIQEFTLQNSNYQINFISQSQDYRLYLDQEVLTTILTNLLINACQYSDHSSPIILSLNCKKRVVNFVIQNQGMEIKASDLPHIFEPFYRGENTTGVSGSGLGLTVVKRLIDLYNGKITIKSKIGVGTIVTVSLPLSSLVST